MESDAEIRCRKQPTLSKFPSTRSNTRLSTRYALDVLHGVGLDAGSTVAAKRVLMSPEAAFPYVFAAEGAQHPPIKPPRSTTLAAAPAQQDFTLIHSAVFQLIAVGVVLLAFPYRRLRKRYPYDSSPVNAS